MTNDDADWRMNTRRSNILNSAAAGGTASEIIGCTAATDGCARM